MRMPARKRSGSAITETGPALFVLLIIIFFPLMDIIGMAAGFAFSWLVHAAELRELTVVRAVTNPVNHALDIPGTLAVYNTTVGKVDADTVSKMAGFSQFCGITSGNYATKISHSGTSILPAASAGARNEIQLTTTVRIRPLLIIPVLQNVPGLSADIPFSFTSTEPLEDNGQTGLGA